MLLNEVATKYSKLKKSTYKTFLGSLENYGFAISHAKFHQLVRGGRNWDPQTIFLCKFSVFLPHKSEEYMFIINCLQFS